MKQYSCKFNLWKLTLALLLAALVVSLAVGVFAFAADGDGADAPEISMGIPTEVVQLQVEGYTLSNGYYRAGENADGDYAFWQGMPIADAVSKVIGVTVKDENGNNFTLSVADNAVTVESTESTVGSGDNHIATFNVTVKGATEENDTVLTYDVNFIAVRPYTLTLIDENWQDNVDETLTPTYDVSYLREYCDGTFALRNTNGTQGTIVDYTNLVITGTLAPSKVEIDSMLADSLNTYSTYISVSTSIVGVTIEPLNVKVKNIKYVSPTNVGRVANLSAQTARTEFNYDSATIVFVYGSEQVTISFSDVKEYFEPIYYESNQSDAIAKSELTTAIRYVAFTYEIPCLDNELNVQTLTGTTAKFRITVAQRLQDNPIVSDLNPTYTDGGSVITVKELPKEDEINGIDFKVSSKDGRTDTFEFTKQEDGYSVKFLQGGEFYITILLTKEAAGDYRWLTQTQESSNPKTNGQYELIYTITVSQAPIDVTSDFPAELVYGDGEPTPTVTAKYEGTETVAYSTTNKGDSFVDGTNPVYQLFYYGASLTDHTTAEKATTTCPTEPGTYFVIVKTNKTEKFKAGESDPTEFKIVARTIKLTATFSSPMYERGKIYGTTELADQLSIDNIADQDKGNQKAVVDIAFATSGVTSVTHAGEYRISLTITEQFKNKYAWEGTTSLTGESTFTIQKRPQIVSMAVGTPSFVYGTTDVSPNVNYVWTNPTDSNYQYAQIGELKYYKQGDENDPAKAIGNADFHTWDVGTYVAKYDVKYGSGDNNTDYDLPTLESTFTITRRAISNLTITAENGTYNGQDHTFTINGWKNNLSEMGILAEDIRTVLNIIVDGKLLTDNTTKITTNLTNDYDGFVYVQEAGTYNVSIEIIDGNYKWSGEEDGAASAVVTASARIEQQVLALRLDCASFTFDGTNQVPNVLSDTLVGFNYSWTTPKYFCVEGEKETEISDPTTIIVVGTYRIKLDGFNIDETIDGAYSSAVNFKLPDSAQLDFAIIATGVLIPEFNTEKDGVNSVNKVTATYNGDAYDITDYIANWSKYQYLPGKSSVVITITNSANESVLKNAGAYTVTIVPADNFTWEDGTQDEQIYSFTINKLAISANWGNATLSQVYDGSAKTVSGVTFNVCESDKENVTLTLSYSGELTNGDVVNVGTYTVTVTGATSDNYTTDGGTDLTCSNFVIDPRPIAAPKFADTTELTFNGANQTKDLTLTDYSKIVTGFKWADVIGVKISGVWNFDGVNKNHSDYKASDCFTYDSTTQAVFTFINAGYYTLTFAIEDGNYVWEDDRITELNFTVMRGTVKAPDLLKARAMEWDKTITEFADEILNGSNVSNIEYTVRYGNRKNTDISEVQSSIDRNPDNSGIQGQYFAQLTITGDNAWNYIWEVLPDGEVDANGNKTFVNGSYIENAAVPYEITYNEQFGAQVKLFYAITAGQVTIEYKINSYTFGANGVADGTVIKSDEKVDLESVVYMITTDGIPDIADTLIKFYVRGTTGENRVALSGNDLVNGLPWNVGIYDVEIVITFKESGKYTNWNSNGLILTVSERPVNVEWKFGESSTLSTTYDGKEQKVTATITNIPKSGKSEIDDNVDVSVDLIYKLNNNVTDPKNAGVYTVEVNKITGKDAGNFTITEGKGLSCEFTINKIAVTVNATAVTDHIYGNVVKEEYEKLYTIPESSNKFLEGDDQIKVQIRNGNNLYSRTDSVGTYTVMPTWNGTLPTLTDGTYTIDADNYLITVNTADFEVVARTITVSFNQENAASVYGSKQNVDLYTPAVYSVTCTADGTWLVGQDQRASVFNLASGATADYADAKTYDVMLNVVANGNYIVKVGEVTVTSSVPVKLGDYTISKAGIEITKVEGYNDSYDGNSHNMFVLDATPVNGQKLTWFYQVAGDTLDKNGDWTEYTGNQIKNVKESGTYYIKVKALNHDDAYFVDNNGAGIKVNVTVTKKHVTVQVNLSIQFGETSPDTVNYLMNGIADLKLVNYVFGGLCEATLDSVDGLKIVAGQKLYSVNGYEQGKTSVGEYTTAIEFNPDALQADNYEFANLDGQLTVTQLKLEVLIKNATNTYRQTYGDVKFKTEITLPASTYNNAEKVILTQDTIDYINELHATQGYKGANIFTLNTSAFADTNASTVTNNAGSYKITGAVNNTDGNYNATFKGEDGREFGAHTIIPAELTVQPDIRGYQAAYDEKYHELLYVLIDGNVVVDLDRFASASDGAKVLIQFYVKNLGKDEQFVDDAGANAWKEFSTGVSSVNPTDVDVCHVAVYYRLYVESGNYEDYYGVREAKISVGTNYFKNESDLVINGWTYGLYDEKDNVNGFKATINDPQVAFDSVKKQDHANKLKVTLKYNGGAIEALTGEYNTISELFEDMWSKGLFSVGNYVLTLTMDSTDNYGVLSKDIEFNVTAKELVITAKDQTVVYGNDFAETGYTFNVAGLVANKTGGTVETEEIAFAGMNTNFFSSAYEIGRAKGSVGKYAIITTANAVFDNGGNYTFKYVVTNADGSDKALTVTPREVNVSINDYTNIYNDDVANLASELKFNIVEGSLRFVEGDNEVIVLRTLAIAGFGIDNGKLSASTNNVIVASRNTYGQAQEISAYPVYAVFGADAKGEGKIDYNYVIKFSGCSYTGALENYQSACDEGKTITVIAEGDTPIVGGAGSYKIERATIGITYDGVYHIGDDGEVNGTVYSGAVNYYKATTTDSSVQMTFKYGYNKTEKGNYEDIDADRVVNAGYYIAYGRLTSDNYYDSNANQLFEITKATITLTADPASVQYGTTLKEGEPTNKLDGKFSGFTYTYNKGAVLQSVYDAYIATNPVTYGTNGYTPYTPAGTMNMLITPVCANDEAGNIVFVNNGAELTVLKRDVVVTVYGFYDAENNELAQCDYLGTGEATQAKLESIYNATDNSGKYINLNRFMSVNDQGDSGDGLDALKVAFSLGGVFNANAYGYAMSVTSGSSNYNVKFRTKTGEDLREQILSTDTDAPKFVINKAKLTIYANAIVNSGIADGYSIIYGNEVSSVTWTYHVDGIKGGDNFAALLNASKQTIEYSRTYNNKEYKAWESNVGEEYVVAVKTLSDLDNYDLQNSEYKATTLTITKRTIAVSTENQIFTWDKGNNGGAFGIAHEAVLRYFDTLTANNDAINKNINSEYRPKNSGVKYSTVANSSYNQNENAAPTRVGDYNVTITLTDNNYKFENGSESVIKFSVMQREVNELNLRWNDSTIRWNDGENFSAKNSIEEYIDNVMEIVLFTFTPYGSSGSRVVPLGNAETANSYYFDGQKLVINATERGRYEVRFKLRDSALWNYKLVSSNETLVVSSFVISSSTIDMTLEIADWTYNTTPNAPVVTVNGAAVNGVEFSYARVTDITDIADYYGNGENGKGQLSSIGTLPIDSYTSINSIIFNAGYYVVRATYWGTVADSSEMVSVVAYFVFYVEKATVNAPTADVENYTFNGKEQSLAIEYLTNLVRASYDGRISINSNGIDVFATDAKTYTVTFTLVDDSNYEWSDGGIEAYELLWTIAKDESDNSDSNVLTIANKSFESTYGSVSVTGEVVASGYVSNVDRYYVVASADKDFDTINQWASDVQWIYGLPSNVGNYYVKLVLNGNSNFSDKETYVKLQVVPYVIELSASGTITYGNDWQAAVRYEDVVSPYGHRVTGTATYSLVKDYGELEAGGEYYVIADHDEYGIVNGLTMSDNAGANYIIKAVEGRLIVNQRNVTVTLGNASSQYGREIDLDGVSVVYGQGQLIDGDSLNLTLYVVDGENAINVGGYIINADYDNDNYNVTINPGTYTITARRITIEVVQGGGTYGGTINPVSLSKVLDDRNVDIKDFVEANNLDLDIYYVGYANDNTSYDSTNMPQKAGTYIATVRGSDNDNFVIIGEVSTSFVINKKSVDGSLIKIANQAYTKEALTPVLNVDEFVALYGNDIFEQVASDEEFINAGTYTVTLRIKDFANYKWQSVEIAERNYTFTIDKANNDLTSDIIIAGWSYGEYSVDKNLPAATVKFGQSEVTFLYSDRVDGTYTSGAPAMGDVGDYWVKVTVPEDANYKLFTSEPVKFAITKRALIKPTLTIITDGEGKNDTYTGEQLVAAIVGYDMALMNLVYDDINVNGGQIIARATNAGIYEIKLSIANPHNYRWQGEDGNEITLTWFIAPKAIAKPTENTSKFIVNGQVLTYIPEGFDEETMTISGNETAYGGEFPVTIGLKDKSNYVWAEGGTDDFTLTWNVVGINTVFTIVTSVLGGASAMALMALGIQLIRDKRRKRLIDLAIDARSQAEAMKAPRKPQVQTDEQTAKGGKD